MTKQSATAAAIAASLLAAAVAAYVGLHKSEPKDPPYLTQLQVLLAQSGTDPGEGRCLTCEIVVNDPDTKTPKEAQATRVCGKQGDIKTLCIAKGIAWCEPKDAEKLTPEEQKCSDAAFAACIDNATNGTATGAIGRLVPGTCLKSEADPGVDDGKGGKLPTPTLATADLAVLNTGAACSTGVNCESYDAKGARWVAVPRGSPVMQPGQWRGAGCVPALSVENEAREHVAGCTLPNSAGCLIPPACRP
jgi:hypothetical protein